MTEIMYDIIYDIMIVDSPEPSTILAYKTKMIK